MGITNRFSWTRLSLVGQFALAGGVVMLIAALLGGFFVSRRIEEVVVRNTANATALYMESVIAPLMQDMASRADLSVGWRAELGSLLAGTALGKRVVSFKIWRPGGLVVDASDRDLVGRVFPLTENLDLAFKGEVRAEFNDNTDEEDRDEASLNLPLLEIYSPIREVNSGKVIAVAEFYEIGTQLQRDLDQARALSWFSVALVMTLIGGSLFAIVLRGSRTIDRQVADLRQLSARNVALRLRVQGASARFSAMNDQALRRIGADLHDGPAQLMGFAALRLDALKPDITSDKGKAEWEAIRAAIKEAISETRNISRGVSLPDIDEKRLTEIVQAAVDNHAARTGTTVAVQMTAEPVPDLPDAVKICCFRFVQEGLTNVWRHAEGKGQEVRLDLAGQILTISVLDRGAGLAAALVEPGTDDTGLGLGGLADRVESLGGELSLDNREDGPGAVLKMELDLGEVG